MSQMVGCLQYSNEDLSLDFEDLGTNLGMVGPAYDHRVFSPHVKWRTMEQESQHGPLAFTHMHYMNRQILCVHVRAHTQVRVGQAMGLWLNSHPVLAVPIGYVTGHLT